VQIASWILLVPTKLSTLGAAGELAIFINRMIGDRSPFVAAIVTPIDFELRAVIENERRRSIRVHRTRA
jgi:hypothetical protein